MDDRRKKIADAMAAVEEGVPTHIQQLQKMLEIFSESTQETKRLHHLIEAIPLLSQKNRVLRTFL